MVCENFKAATLTLPLIFFVFGMDGTPQPERLAIGCVLATTFVLLALLEATGPQGFRAIRHIEDELDPSMTQRVTIEDVIDYWRARR